MEKQKIKTPMSFLLEECLDVYGESLISVVLFGSRARKFYNELSDFDIIIVAEDYKNPNIREKFLLKYGKKLDVHTFSKQEIIDNFESFSPIFTTLILGKIILFDKNRFFIEEFNKFVKRAVSLNIKYCEGGEIWKIKKIARNLLNSQ